MISLSVHTTGRSDGRSIITRILSNARVYTLSQVSVILIVFTNFRLVAFRTVFFFFYNANSYLTILFRTLFYLRDFDTRSISRIPSRLHGKHSIWAYARENKYEVMMSNRINIIIIQRLLSFLGGTNTRGVYLII